LISDARLLRAFSHGLPENPDSEFSETIMRKGMKQIMPIDVQQQSGRWAGQGARTTERMDAIRNIKTMAGSPDADRKLRSASRNLAHGLCVSGV
jgi:hypothetical protein